ncbi:Protein ERGIC-53 [Thelohanellus kitauei]|uniref:Protein ERGIC-53 n=1 Tax=Thelohanellus kitauei TaxID=669202 RepID=A0A0C2MQZ4_THEKT|nr:Protein ERGIC-53 [Thelohanellus kitauei]
MWTLFVCFLFVVSESKFEYKYSIKAPILDENNNLPFFEHFGNSMLDNTKIRLVPSIQNQKGLVQSRYKTNFEWWEVLIDFHIFGQSRIGADGMAFWFTDAKGVTGPTFGRSENWYGLGLVLDSYDNDHQRNNPIITGYLNNATYVYDHSR